MIRATFPDGVSYTSGSWLGLETVLACVCVHPRSTHAEFREELRERAWVWSNTSVAEGQLSAERFLRELERASLLTLTLEES